MSLFVHHNAQTYVKVNGFTLPALMLNAGIETKLTDKILRLHFLSYAKQSMNYLKQKKLKLLIFLA